MNNMTTPPDLAAIKARCDAATPGPWIVSDTSIVTDEKCIAVIEEDGGYAAGFEQRAANAELIAHARTDIPALLSLIASQAARLKELEAGCKKASVICEEWIARGAFDDDIRDLQNIQRHLTGQPTSDTLAESPTWPYVVAFAKRIEAKLAANRHKGDREGWIQENPYNLLDRIAQEHGELHVALDRVKYKENIVHKEREDIINEAADVANFAMMIADIYNGVKVEPSKGGGEG